MFTGRGEQGGHSSRTGEEPTPSRGDTGETRRRGHHGERGLQRRHQARRAGLGAGLDAVRARRGRPRARPTSWSCCTTTPGWRRGRRTAGGSTCRRWTGWPPNGLTYTQWHTTALCSPTRSTFLTGRNHHVNRCATIMEATDGFPGAAGRIPDGVRHDRPRPAGQRLQHLLGRQGPQRPGGGQRPGRQPLDVAAAAGLRPLLRLPRRRDQQLVSRPGRGQPLHRAALLARGGLPPLEGPGRPGAADAAQPAGLEPVEALVPVVLPRRQPRAAPRARGVHRQVRGRLRRRLRGLPRVGAGPDDREGHHARGHRAHPAQPDARGRRQRGRLRAAVGRAQRRREAALRPLRRGLRRLLASTPTPRSAGSSTTSRRPASSTTR